MRADARIAVVAAMLVIFVAMSADAATFPPIAGVVPLCVGVIALALCIWVLWDEIRRARHPASAPDDSPAADRPRDLRERPARFDDEIALIVWVWLFAGAIIGGGFLIGGTLATLAFVRLRLRESPVVTIGAGAAVYLTLYLVFERMLGLVLFQGLVAGS